MRAIFPIPYRTGGDFDKQANFGVTSHKVYPKANGGYYEWAYKVPVTSPDGTFYIAVQPFLPRNFRNPGRIRHFSQKTTKNSMPKGVE
ncbi:MAG: hypothetical protein AB7F88_03435 [Pyrinomonadaceae bacterium]